MLNWRVWSYRSAVSGVGRPHCRSYPGENGFARVTLVEGDRVFMGSNRGGVLQEPGAGSDF